MRGVQERIALGRYERNRLSRTAHAELHSSQRKFDPIEVLVNSTRDRLPKLLPLKYARMAASPYAFFRGRSGDHGRGPWAPATLWFACNSAVMRMFKTPAVRCADGKLMFELVDFDETIRGPLEWDLKRMATSIILARREAGRHHRRQVTKAQLPYLPACCSGSRQKAPENNRM